MKPNYECLAVLSDAYINYLDICVPDNPDPFNYSIQDQIFKFYRNESFQFILIGDGLRNDIAYVRLPYIVHDIGEEQWIRRVNLRVIKGDIRKVPKKGRIIMGRGNLMGCIAHGIKSGRAFKGRG